MIGAVDIGGTKIAVGIVDAQGRLLSRAESPTDPQAGYTHAMDRTIKMLRAVASQASTEIRGIGIGSTGPVDPVTGRLAR